MPEVVQLQLLGAFHNNQRLFSDHYLNEILPRRWDSLQDEAAQVMAQLRRHYSKFTPNPSNEAQTEEDWIKPVLHALGHSFEVQASLKVPDGTQRPDYIFYQNDAALVANKHKTVDAENLQSLAFAVGDAKSWIAHWIRRSRRAAGAATRSIIKILRSKSSFICSIVSYRGAYSRMAASGDCTISRRRTSWRSSTRLITRPDRIEQR